jgi:hypothetical protein
VQRSTHLVYDLWSPDKGRQRARSQGLVEKFADPTSA